MRNIPTCFIFFLHTAKAEAYKEDGNHEFKKKQYHIAVDNYTEGIKCKCPDKQLNAILYTNRAAAQFYRGIFIWCFLKIPFRSESLTRFAKKTGY